MAIRIAAVVGVLLVVVGVTFAATAWAARRWEAQIHDVVLRLSTSNAVRVATYSERELDQLPPPVAPPGHFAYWRGTVEPAYDLAPATPGPAKTPVRE